MAKKEEVKEPQPIEEAPKPEEQEKEAEVKESQVSSKEEFEQLRTELQKMEGRWQSAQGVISKQHTEIQALKDNQELWKVLIGMRAQEMGVSEEEAEQDIQKKKPNFMQQFSMVEQQLEQKRLREKVGSYQTTVEQELGLRAGDEDYETIQAFVQAGKWDRADKKIEALKAKKTEQPKSEESKKVEETEEQRINRLVDEKLKEKMVEKGLLTPEGAEPSAPSGHIFTREQIANMPTEEYEKLQPEINKARREGRIKQ